MTQDAFINILIAEDNDVSREMMSSILETQGYKVFGAINGGSAIEVVQSHNIDVAIVDINMAPEGGFEFIKYLVVKGIDLPVVIVTGDNSSDILLEASALGVRRVIQKPIEPSRLIEVVRRILKRQGLNPRPLAVKVHNTRFSPEELMDKAIDLAEYNARSKKGGPFGAVIADKEGQVLGTGASGIISRSDPTAHAEVMAIRQASERLGNTSLADYVIYCSSEPTMIGKALIMSVGIKKVYFGLGHEEINAIRAENGAHQSDPEYIQLGHDDALKMFTNLENQDEKNIN